MNYFKINYLRVVYLLLEKKIVIPDEIPRSRPRPGGFSIGIYFYNYLIHLCLMKKTFINSLFHKYSCNLKK